MWIQAINGDLVNLDFIASIQPFPALKVPGLEVSDQELWLVRAFQIDYRKDDSSGFVDLTVGPTLDSAKQTLNSIAAMMRVSGQKVLRLTDRNE